MSQREPGEEELRAAFEEEMRNISVHDVVVQTLVTLVNLGGRRLGLPAPGEQEGESKDLAQARLAIDASRALLPLVPPDVATPVRNALSQLQIAYSREAQAAGGAQAGEEAAAAPSSAAARPATAPGDAGARQGASDQAERAKARAKIWTPPGA